MTAQLTMEISSIAAHTKHSSNNSTGKDTAGDNHPVDAHSTIGDELLTNVALQNRIGNLALAFPNSLHTHSVHYKRVVGHDGGAGAMGEALRSKPRTGDRTVRNRGGDNNPAMLIRPDLCNINPDDLDENTLRNMHAIGIDFATKKTNRLKPFQSRAARTRKWRSVVDEESRGPGKRQQVEQKEPIDYDGTSSNAENGKILQRRLAAWPTHDTASGIGSGPDKLVGATLSSAVDQVSYMNTTDAWNTIQAKGEQVLAGLPETVRNLQTPGLVKSAVGSSRNKAAILARTLVEKSQAGNLTGTEQILDSPTRTRHLQT